MCARLSRFCLQVSRKKQRLDEACQALRPELSRNVIQSWICLGKVQVDGKVISKAGAPVPAAANVQIFAELPKFVCRWGLARPMSFVVLSLMWPDFDSSRASFFC